MARVLTASLISSLLKCPYLGAMQYLGWRSKSESEALIAGSAWHDALEAIINGEKPKKSEYYTEADLQRWKDGAEGAGFFDHKWEPEKEYLRQIHSQLWVAVKVDGICEEFNALAEHKTTSSKPDDVYFQIQKCSVQSVIYPFVTGADKILWDAKHKKSNLIAFEWLRDLQATDAIQLIHFADMLLMYGLQGLKVRGESCYKFYGRKCDMYEKCWHSTLDEVELSESNRFSEYSEEMRNKIFLLLEDTL